MLTQVKVVVLLLKASSRRLLGSARERSPLRVRKLKKNKGLTREQTKRAMLSWGGLFKNCFSTSVCSNKSKIAIINALPSTS